jgi:3-isopropylmalate/(R)-2-methylmalate dehydratase small subunit
MKKFETLVAKAVILDRDDVDTDQIIPARFLRTTERTGLGQHLFEDWRYSSDGRPREDFVLNAPGAGEAKILIAGRNFGCGSSREHAVWAIQDFGIRVVISTSFADIFAKNALRNGLLPVTADPENHRMCLEAARRGASLKVDLADQRLDVEGAGSFDFQVDPFARTCLLDGVDDLEYILKHEKDIAAFEAAAS